jgi:hypothetical protein
MSIIWYTGLVIILVQRLNHCILEMVRSNINVNRNVKNIRNGLLIN